jgi:hypothetical protein
MQALMDFKRDTNDALVGNEDMQEEIKDMLKNFHSNLLVLQQVVEVLKTKGIFLENLFWIFNRRLMIFIKFRIYRKRLNLIIMNKFHYFHVY